MQRLLPTARQTLAAALLIAAGAAQAQSRVETCQAADEKTIAALFDRWNASLKTLEPSRVVANYASDGVLLATVSNTPRTNAAELTDYFVKFLKNEPQGKIDKRFVKVGCNQAQDVGTYTFRFKDGSKVSARYTYLYEFRNGQWLIAHHHSSMMPEALLSKAAQAAPAARAAQSPAAAVKVALADASR